MKDLNNLIKGVVLGTLNESSQQVDYYSPFNKPLEELKGVRHTSLAEYDQDKSSEKDHGVIHRDPNESIDAFYNRLKGVVEGHAKSHKKPDHVHHYFKSLQDYANSYNDNEGDNMSSHGTLEDPDHPEFGWDDRKRVTSHFFHAVY